MAAESTVKLSVWFGYVEIVTTTRFDGGRMILGGYTKRYDGNGALVEQTPDRATVTVDFCETVARL